MKRWIVWILVLSALGGGGWWVSRQWPERVATLAFWKAKTSTQTKSSRPTTATVAPRDISFAVTAAGDIGPAEQVSVRPEISGRISGLPVDIGDQVKKGAVLFTLDDRDLQIERSQRQTEIEGAKLQIQGARLQVEKMQLSFDRTTKLFTERLVSKEVFDNAKNDLDVAGNSLDLSKNNLERAEKALQLVEDKLSKTKILAPFDCTVLTRPVSVGQAVSGSGGVNAGTEVLTIADLSEMVIFAHINQADVTRLRVSQKVDIEVEAVPGLKLAGRVDRIAPQATIKNSIKGFATRILLKNADAQVRPGMTANITIPLMSADNVLAVPLAAVFTEQGERFVYVRNGDKFARQTIQIGITDYDFAEVTSGLKGGEVVSLVQPSEEMGSKASQAFSGSGPGAGGVRKTAAGGKSGAGKSDAGDKSGSGKSGGGKSSGKDSPGSGRPAAGGSRPTGKST